MEDLKKKILEILDDQSDGFIIPNQSEFDGWDVHEKYAAIYSLIEDGILKKRNCSGLAYEYK